jgi:hypothetical protein
MELDLKEITKAWITSYNATEEQKQLAHSRYDICLSCPSIVEKHVPVVGKKYFQCGECGCPIQKKIYSHKYNPCPLKKWEDVDAKFSNLFNKPKNVV